MDLEILHSKSVEISEFNNEIYVFPPELLVNANDYISELFTQTQFSEVKTVEISLLLYVFLNK